MSLLQQNATHLVCTPACLRGGLSQEHNHDLTHDVDHANKIEEDGTSNYTATPNVTDGHDKNQTQRDRMLITQKMYREVPETYSEIRTLANVRSNGSTRQHL